MQDPPPTQGAAPPPPTDPQVTVVLPDGPIPVGQLPQNAQELIGLRERREVLRDQLDRATNRRSELVMELNRTGAAEARAGIQQRLNLIDARILQLERDQAATERLLSNAPPEVLAQVEARYDRPQGMDEEAAFFLAFFMFGGGLIAAWIISRWRARRARKRAKKMGIATPSGDPRLDELSDAVHAIALEVERIGEGQRFVTHLLSQRREGVPLPEQTQRR